MIAEVYFFTLFYPHGLCRLDCSLYKLINLLRELLLRRLNDMQVRLRHRMLSPRKIVQQSSNGRIDVSYVSIFSATSMISCLSKPISGRNTGIEQTSFVAARLCIVWTRHLPDTLSGSKCQGYSSHLQSALQYASYTDA